MTRLLAFFVRALAASTLVAVPAGAGQQSAALDAVDKYLAECHERSENATRDSRWSSSTTIGSRI